jgi:mono/diheme cytochrome c family protein
MRVQPLFLFLPFLTLCDDAVAQSPEQGRREYENRCSGCHGGDGQGGERAQGIVERLTVRSDDELAALIRTGLPGAGMPG